MLLRNAINEIRLDFKVPKVIERPDNPKTAEHGTDKTGRVVDSATGRRSAVEQDRPA